MLSIVNSRGVIAPKTWIYEGKTSFMDKVTAAFMKNLEKNALPCQITEEVYGSDDPRGSKGILLKIDGGFKFCCVLGATTFGNFLSISFCTLVDDTDMMLNLPENASQLDLAYLEEHMISACHAIAFLNSVNETVNNFIADIEHAHDPRM